MELEEMEKMLESGKLTIPHCSEKSSESTCPKCKGRGWIPKIVNGYEVFRECECHIAERLQNNRNFAKIPKNYENVRLDGITTELYSDANSKKTIDAIKKLMAKYLESFKAADGANGTGFYFYSHVKGSGKTNMAIGLLNEIAEMNKSSDGNFISYRFATVGEILNTIKDSFDKTDFAERESKSESRQKLIHDLSTVDLLVLDDFGMEKVTEWVNETIYNVVNARYIERLPIIVTSNFSIEESKYDERITNRLKEMCFSLHFPEESLRQKVGLEKAKELRK